ncbi:MAG: hypothetical protein ACRECU_00805 [Methylocella sp.]
MTSTVRVVLGSTASFAEDAYEDWVVYCNARFGQCANIPSTFKSDPPPANGDGLIFRDENAMSVTVSASYNLDWSLEDAIKMTLDTLGEVGPSTYQKQGKDWYVVSGHKGDNIYYVKSFVKKSTISTLWIEYPSSQKSADDDIASQISSSFRPAK